MEHNGNAPDILRATEEVFEFVGTCVPESPEPTEMELAGDEYEKIRTLLPSLKFMHVRAIDVDERPVTAGGLTVAFETPVKGQTVIPCSVALCNRNEIFVKKSGVQLAAYRYGTGQAIPVRIDPECEDRYETQLHDFFSFMI
jgi:hypothetical protein